MTGHTSWPAQPTFTNHTDQPPACHGHDPDLWFRTTDQAHAKTICAQCPHEHACRTWAYAQPTHSLYGVWGGTTQAERRRRRKDPTP